MNQKEAIEEVMDADEVKIWTNITADNALYMPVQKNIIIPLIEKATVGMGQGGSFADIRIRKTHDKNKKILYIN